MMHGPLFTLASLCVQSSVMAKAISISFISIGASKCCVTLNRLVKLICPTR